MKNIRVAINGFGRIGRAFFKIASERKEIEIVAVNDLGDIENMAYLLKYDSVYGKSGLDVKVENGKKSLSVNGNLVKFLAVKNISELPWKDLDIDVVVESTGLFTDYEKAKEHVSAGAKRVVISAPGKGDETNGKTVLMGINEKDLEIWLREIVKIPFVHVKKNMHVG